MIFKWKKERIKTSKKGKTESRKKMKYLKTTQTMNDDDDKFQCSMSSL